MFLFIDIIVIINLNGKDAFKTDWLGWNGLDAWQGLPWLSLAWIGLAWLGMDWLALAWISVAWVDTWLRLTSIPGSGGLPWLGLVGSGWLGLHEFTLD
jgi:hypothetical protein